MRSNLDTRCFAIDTWLGDSHTGEYGNSVYEEFRSFHDEQFGGFSTLLRCTFDEGLNHIQDQSVDLLHIDGCHTYEAVRHDFESWQPKLSGRAVVLLHDTNEHGDDFGVRRFWSELSQRYPAFEFLHGHGLGVLAVGACASPAVLTLCALERPSEIAAIRERFATVGSRWLHETREILL